MITADLVPDLAALRLDRFPAVLVHSSLRGLGWVDGGAPSVVKTLLRSAPGTTWLFPTLTGSADDGPAQPPCPDLRTAPCYTGAIPEAARARPDGLRSTHPTHSVTAIGPQAEVWSAGHELVSTPCDAWSPFGRLVAEGGAVLLLGGVTNQSNTTLHCLEELAAVPYHLHDQPTRCTVVDRQGQRVEVTNRLHSWDWGRNFLVVDEPLTRAGAMQVAPVGASLARLVTADAMAELLLPRLAADPLWLLDAPARERWLQHHPN